MLARARTSAAASWFSCALVMASRTPARLPRKGRNLWPLLQANASIQDSARREQVLWCREPSEDDGTGTCFGSQGPREPLRLRDHRSSVPPSLAYIVRQELARRPRILVHL